MHAHDVGVPDRDGERRVVVGAGDLDHDRHLALRAARHDGGALDGEPLALEVDVVDLVLVHEAAGGDVADLGVVLPRVPQAAGDLDDVAGLGPCLRGVGCGAAAERGGLGVGQGDAHEPAGAPGAGPVEGLDDLGDVERLGVGDAHARDQADPGGAGRGGSRDGGGVDGAGQVVVVEQSEVHPGVVERAEERDRSVRVGDGRQGRRDEQRGQGLGVAAADHGVLLVGAEGRDRAPALALVQAVGVGLEVARLQVDLGVAGLPGDLLDGGQQPRAEPPVAAGGRHEDALDLGVGAGALERRGAHGLVARERQHGGDDVGDVDRGRPLAARDVRVAGRHLGVHGGAQSGDARVVPPGAHEGDSW
ncbi:hypothetical protein GCM10010413_23090 [Promicromonospora sukumoe]